ncbi:hypothetical protein [Falsiroseomonas sp. HW251]|uniref:hypothetical protein n=1 Tax=Falsiroseomonas sp. HW251 TaxID=3390998 RepID=UPI003D31F2BA
MRVRVLLFCLVALAAGLGALTRVTVQDLRERARQLTAEQLATSASPISCSARSARAGSWRASGCCWAIAR